MRTLRLTNFKLARTTNGIPRSEVIVTGHSTGTLIEGAVFEAALEWQGLTLAFITDDIPFEDTLRIYLFDQHFRVIDSAKLGSMYSTGAFSDLNIVGPDIVTFQFYGDTTWTIRLLASETFAIPVLSSPRGVSRPMRLRRRFNLYGNPLPETRR